MTDAGAARGAVEWSRIDRDLSVATRRDDFAGYVDRREPGRFLAFDHHARLIGAYPDESRARAAVGPVTPAPHGPAAARVLDYLRARLQR